MVTVGSPGLGLAARWTQAVAQTWAAVVFEPSLPVPLPCPKKKSRTAKFREVTKESGKEKKERGGWVPTTGLEVGVGGCQGVVPSVESKQAQPRGALPLTWDREERAAAAGLRAGLSAGAGAGGMGHGFSW